MQILLKENRVETEEDIFIYEFEKLDSWNNIRAITIADDDRITMFKDDGSLHTPTEEDVTAIKNIIADWHERFDGGVLDRKKSRKLYELSQKAQEFEQNVNKNMWFISSVFVEKEVQKDDETTETVKEHLVINGDRRTRSNIQDLITYQPTDNVIYRDYENIERTLTKDELKIILKEHVMNGQALYEAKWKMEEQIKSCTTIEELNAIEIKFTMCDFSK